MRLVDEVLIGRGAFHSSSSTAQHGQMPLWISADRFPFQYRRRAIKTADIEMFALAGCHGEVTDRSLYCTAGQLSVVEVVYPASIPPSP